MPRHDGTRLSSRSPSRTGSRTSLGAGQMWETVADRLAAAGHPVRLGEEVVGVRHADGRVISVVVRDGGGATLDVLGSEFISTMPIRELIAKLQPAPPSMVRTAAA